MAHNKYRDSGFRENDRNWDRDARRREYNSDRYNLNDRDRYERNYYERHPSDDYRGRYRNEYNMYGEGYPAPPGGQDRGYRDRYEHDRNRYRNRMPQGYDEDRYRRDNAYPYDHNEPWRYGNDGPYDHGKNYRGEDRNWWERTRDEMSAWFGDERAEYRRRMDEMYGHHGKGPKGYHRSDERIEEDIEDNLYNDSYLDARGMEVEVKDGVITLSGTVDSKWAKRRAEDMSEVISGVKDVKNHLSVDRTGNDRNTSGNTEKKKNNTI